MAPFELIKNVPGPIVILGAGGFIGQNLWPAWSKERTDVYGVGHYPAGQEVPANFFKCDFLLARPSFFKWLTDLKPRVIINLLSYGNRPEQQDVGKIWAINVDFLEELHAWWQQNRTPPPGQGPKQNAKGPGKSKKTADPWDLHLFLQAGSSSEYGLACEEAREDRACLPLSEYGRSKLQAAYLIQAWAQQEGFPGMHVRFFSVYGPHEASYRLIPSILRQVWQNEWPPLAPAATSRDFVYVADLITALSVMAGQFKFSLHAGQIYNIASGHATTLEELTSIVRQQYPHLPPPAWGDTALRPWEPGRPWFGSTVKTKAAFNWAASTDLATGLAITAREIAQTPPPPAAPAKKTRASKKNATQVDLSVIIPLYQDQENLAELRRRLTPVLLGLGRGWEIILVDDASPEGATWEAVQVWAAEDKRVKGIRLAMNLNSQGALLVGIKQCHGKMAVMMDSDLQDPPELIPAMLTAAEAGHEIVAGIYKGRQEGIFMRLARFIFYKLLGLLHGRRYPCAGNFCLFNSGAVLAAQQLTTIPFWRTWRTLVPGKHGGVAFVRPARFAGKSHNHFLSNLRWALQAFWSMPNFIAEYFLLLGTLIIGTITIFHPMVWPIMLLAEFFLVVQYFILRYLAQMPQRSLPPCSIIDQINLP